MYSRNLTTLLALLAVWGFLSSDGRGAPQNGVQGAGSQHGAGSNQDKRPFTQFNNMALEHYKARMFGPPGENGERQGRLYVPQTPNLTGIPGEVGPGYRIIVAGVTGDRNAPNSLQFSVLNGGTLTMDSITTEPHIPTVQNGPMAGTAVTLNPYPARFQQKQDPEEKTITFSAGPVANPKGTLIDVVCRIHPDKVHMRFKVYPNARDTAINAMNEMNPGFHIADLVKGIMTIL
jgi:hypothetical protein